MFDTFTKKCTRNYTGAYTKIHILVSKIRVVHVYANAFQVYPACPNIANGIKPGSYSKKTDKHAADFSKAVCWGVK